MEAAFFGRRRYDQGVPRVQLCQVFVGPHRFLVDGLIAAQAVPTMSAAPLLKLLIAVLPSVWACDVNRSVSGRCDTLPVTTCFAAVSASTFPIIPSCALTQRYSLRNVDSSEHYAECNVYDEPK